MDNYERHKNMLTAFSNMDKVVVFLYMQGQEK